MPQSTVAHPAHRRLHQAMTAGAHRTRPFAAASAAAAAAAAEGPVAVPIPVVEMAAASSAACPVCPMCRWCPMCRRCSKAPSSLPPEATPAAAAAWCGALAPAERPAGLRPHPSPPAVRPLVHLRRDGTVVAPLPRRPPLWLPVSTPAAGRAGEQAGQAVGCRRGHGSAVRHQLQRPSAERHLRDVSSSGAG